MEQIKEKIEKEREEMKRIWEDLKKRGSFEECETYEEWEKETK